MEVGFIRDKLEIKFLILYIAARLSEPADGAAMQDLTMCDDGIDYFDYAECLNDRGATDEAIDYINEVRARVNVVPLQKGMSKAEVLKHLQDVERPCELSLEGSRWYDLIRWGIVDSALKEHNKPYATNFVDTKHTMLPIPHKEFLMNPDWVQNPGYSK